MKRQIVFFVLFMKLAFSLFAQSEEYSVQVTNPESSNLSVSETSWLPGQIQDKLKANLKEYLGMKIVVDSKSEATLKKLQAESESAARNETTAIELGKITTAKFAVFTKLRKTGSGYTISIDFTDLTTGVQKATCTSKEYSKAEYLYGSTGAVDELTLALANKLNVSVSELNKKLLSNGSSNFNIDDQFAIAKQNEEQYQKMLKDYDTELQKLMSSNDINAIQNKNRIEAEKALLVEKQNAERKRQEELKTQMARAAEDEKLEAERSIALKTQRDKMAKDAAAKAAEVRKLKMEKQGVLGQINVIESKKRALVEIRQGVEARSLELYDQMLKDKESEESHIRNKTYSTVELGSDGQPTEAAKKRRENQIIKSNEDLSNKFFADCENLKKIADCGENSVLLSEIRTDIKKLSNIRTVSSMGDELKVIYGKYEGGKNGWNAYLSLYSDGILLYTDNFIVNYEALSGKKAPDMETELNDAVIEEYTNNVDMYNSLLIRGDPIIYFEIDYNVTAEGDDKPSQYKFNFSKIRVINTVNGKVTQTNTLNKVLSRTMKPSWDLRKINGIVHEFKRFQDKAYKWDILKIQELSESKNISYEKLLSDYVDKEGDFNKVIKRFEEERRLEERRLFEDILEELGYSFVRLPDKSIKIGKTEVTQKMYVKIMGSNPSLNSAYGNPVENVSLFDAVYFCNKLSEKFGFTPVYSIKGDTNPDKWRYKPHQRWPLDVVITQNSSANGFRLPTVEEWRYAAEGGQNYKYSGSDNLDEVGWYGGNSGEKTHPVAQKKANDYGLYDMSGNVSEWCWNSSCGKLNKHYNLGGSYFAFSGSSSECMVSKTSYRYGDSRNGTTGFRIVCNTD